MCTETIRKAVAATQRVWALENSNLAAALRGAREAGMHGEDVYDFAHAYVRHVRFAADAAPDVDPFEGFGVSA